MDALPWEHSLVDMGWHWWWWGVLTFPDNAANSELSLPVLSPVPSQALASQNSCATLCHFRASTIPCNEKGHCILWEHGNVLTSPHKGLLRRKEGVLPIPSIQTESWRVFCQIIQILCSTYISCLIEYTASPYNPCLSAWMYICR